MIHVRDVHFGYGGHEIVSGVNLHIRVGDRVGLVGRNGCGKTTLLRLIAGELECEQGQIDVRGDVRRGYLPQQAVSGSTQSLWDEARSGMAQLDALREELDAAERALTDGTPESVARHDLAMDAFRLGGGFSQEERIGEVLHGLGFGKEDWARPCPEFSGGWQMRIALARLLLSEPNVLLLDEPTNHLDLHARSWLAGWLSRYRHAVVVVSHDRHLLDRVVRRVVEVRRGRLFVFAGNCTTWLSERDVRRVQEQQEYDAQQAEIARLERFVERFKAKATKAAQARSRQKQLDKMERLQAPLHDKLPRFALPEAPPCSHEAVILRNADLGWPDGPVVLHTVSLVLERGMRVAIVGPNGAGKSTLLHACAGRLALKSGFRRLGKDVHIGLFTQDLAQELPNAEGAADVVVRVSPTVTPQRARAVLGALGLPGDAGLRRVGELSGGERARVALAAFAVKANNVLLLDEPTNHLDTVTVEVLARSLESFEGAILFATHDRYLVERVATHVAHVREGSLEIHPGITDEDFVAVDRGRRATTDQGPRAEVWVERKRRRQNRSRLQREVTEAEAQVESLEGKISDIDEQLFSIGEDFEGAAELGRTRTTTVQQLEQAMTRWEALSEALTSLDQG